MRKIAANYILLPGFELVRNGYVILENGEVVDVVDTGGEIKEIPCLEFYGGMIVADQVREELTWMPGDDLCGRIRRLYQDNVMNKNGLALVQGADFARMLWTPEARIIHLR